MERAREQLKFWQLWERRGFLIRDLSGGMKRRLLIGRAMLNRPLVLILDEPTTGLDLRRATWCGRSSASFGTERTTIILTTHYMDEAAQLWTN